MEILSKEGKEVQRKCKSLENSLNLVLYHMNEITEALQKVIDVEEVNHFEKVLANIMMKHSIEVSKI
jgi:hypothetical protein